jgi:tetratricopeptide (TPR) repeat protein
MYKDKKYDIAIEAYQKLVSQGYKTPEIYYNLANAYYKTEQISSAILFYERGLRLAPSDEDSRFNLKLANQKIIDRLTPVPQFFVVSGWQRFVNSCSSRSWAIFSLVFVWLSFVAFAIYLFIDSIRRLGFYSGVFLLLCAVFFLFLSSSANRIEHGHDEAILTTTNTYVKSAPDGSSTDLFIIHEGIKLDILDRVGTWSKIRLADGKVGWVDQKSYAVI